jgi:hypothetical protein
MAEKIKPCSVCKHKKRATIEAALIRGQSLTSVAKQYGFHRDTVTKHKKLHMTFLLAQNDDAMDKLRGEQWLERIQKDMEMVDKMIEACDRELQDPDNPDKYFLGARSDEVFVSYQDISDGGRLLATRKKASLQSLLQDIKDADHHSIHTLEIKRADTRELLLKSVSTLRDSFKMVYDTQKAAFEFQEKMMMMEKAREQAEKNGGTISMVEELNTFSQKIVIALNGSGDLCKKTGLD